MLKGIPVSKDEFLKLVKQIPKGIGIEPSEETLALRKELEQLKINDSLKYSEGKKKKVETSSRNKNGVLQKTGKTREVDETQQRLEAGVRWYNKNTRDFIVMYKVEGGYMVTKVGPDIKKKYSNLVEKVGKDGKSYQVLVFKTTEWRKSQ